MQKMETDRLRLVPPSQDYAADLFAYGSDPRFTEPLNSRPWTDISQATAFIEGLIARNESSSRAYWVATLGGRAVGTLGLIFDTEKKPRCEIGYGFSPAVWGRGLFLEAALAVLGHAATLGYRTVVAKTRSDNYPAIRAVQKIGFTLVRTIPDYYDLPGGKKPCSVLERSISRSSA